MTFTFDNRKGIKAHIICWAVYIAYEVLVSGTMAGRFSHFSYYLLFYAANISLFYLHACIILPYSTGNRHSAFWKVPLFFIFEMGAYVGLSILITLLLEYLGLRHSKLQLSLVFFTGVVWRGMVFVMFGTGYYFLMNYLRKTAGEMEKALEIQKLTTELVMIEKDFLRSQINPHVLFNTLNFIKYAAKHKPEEAQNAIFLLSEIMGFALEKNNHDLISISKELRQVDNMIALNQLRFNNDLHVRFTREIHDEHLQIIPVVLLTIVENIFKHGDLSDPDHPATISLKTDAHELVLKTTNLKSTSPAGMHSNTGLKNIVSRLAIAYPGAHTFRFAPIGKQFETELRISFDA